MQNVIAENRRRLDRDPRRRPYISAALLGQYRVTVPLLRQYLHGVVLDVGCGTMPYRSVLDQKVTRYDSLDLKAQVPGVTYEADVQDMRVVPDAAYDSVICLEVLEHVPDPFRALAEIRRILRPGGVLVLSVPHLSRIHEAPQDFYRFTNYGLAAMFQRSGFEVVRIERRGGLMSFLAHQLSLVVIGLTWSLPVIRHLVMALNEWLLVRPVYMVDALVDKAGLFALGYTCVARRL